MTCSLPVRSWPHWTRRQYADPLGLETSVQTAGHNSRRVLLLMKHTRRVFLNRSCVHPLCKSAQGMTAATGQGSLAGQMHGVAG